MASYPISKDTLPQNILYSKKNERKVCDSVEDYGLVSVIIPVYNVEQYLKQCVDSVLSQTYQNIEIILVDDGSTDYSGDICDQYKSTDKLIRVIHQKNAGLSEARNQGVDSAIGDYVYFLDSDDWIQKEMLSSLIKRIQDTNADIVFFDSKSFEDSDKGYQIPQRYIRKHDYPTDDGLTVFEQMQANKEFHSAVPLMFIRKSFLDKSTIRFYPGILYEDMLFTFEVLTKAEKVAQCKEAFYQRRYRSNSITQSKVKEKNYLSAATVYRELVAFSQQEEIFDNSCVQKYIARCAYRFIDIYSQLLNADKEKNKQHYQILIDDVIQHNGFGDKALLQRCKSKFHWVVYKSMTKLKVWR